MVRVPETLPIVGEEVPVVPKQDDDNDGTFESECMMKATGSEITIDPRVHPSRVKRVLLHEAFHGILRRTGLAELLDDKMEEAICTALDVHLPAVLERIEEVAQEKEPPKPKRRRSTK